MFFLIHKPNALTFFLMYKPCKTLVLLIYTPKGHLYHPQVTCMPVHATEPPLIYLQTPIIQLYQTEVTHSFPSFLTNPSSMSLSKAIKCILYQKPHPRLFWSFFGMNVHQSKTARGNSKVC